jgi:diadenosine tetraphosphate (Ap4A) HIT family hydrolase
MFTLDSRLSADNYVISDLKISRLLLSNNANYPWLILVPRRENLVELTDLSFADQTEVLREINQVSKMLQEKFAPHKINIATLGNMVRQLHIHVIARFENDAAFPNPVWGGAKKIYEKADAEKLVKELQLILKENE